MTKFLDSAFLFRQEEALCMFYPDAKKDGEDF